MIVSTNGAKVVPPEKQDTVSINSENVTKDFDTASFSVNGEEPPPAYQKPTRAAVQVARVVAVTVVAVALILGAAIVLAAWIQTRNQTTTTEITVEAPIVPENGALISERVNTSIESAEKDVKGQRRLDEGNELESGEMDVSPLITVIKLPLDVNFGDITDDMLNFKNNGNKNCYVEKKKIEDFGENPLKNIPALLGLNVSEADIKIVGEKVVMICDDTPKPNPFGGMMAPPLAPLSFPMPRLDGRLLPFPFQGPPRPSPFSLNLNPFLARPQPPFPRNDVMINTIPLKLPFPFNPRPDNAPIPRMNRFPPAFAASLSLESVSDEDDSEESNEESDEELSPRPSPPRFTSRLNNLLLNRATNNNNNIQDRRFENARRSFDRPNFGRPLEDPEARKFSSPRPSNPFQALVNSFMEQTRMRLPLLPNRRAENSGVFTGPNRPQINRPIPVGEPAAVPAEKRFDSMQLPPRVPATAIPQVPRQFAPPIPPSFNPANAQIQATMVAPPAPARQPNLAPAEPPMITRNARFLQHPQPLPLHRPGVFPQQRALDTDFIQPR